MASGIQLPRCGSKMSSSRTYPRRWWCKRYSSISLWWKSGWRWVLRRAYSTERSKNCCSSASWRPMNKETRMAWWSVRTLPSHPGCCTEFAICVSGDSRTPTYKKTKPRSRRRRTSTNMKKVRKSRRRIRTLSTSCSRHCWAGTISTTSFSSILRPTTAKMMIQIISTWSRLIGLKIRIMRAARKRRGCRRIILVPRSPAIKMNRNQS